MLSPFEISFAWAGTLARARDLLNRLTAVTIQVELLGESAPVGEATFVRALDAARAELAEVSHEARTLVEVIAAQLPASQSAEIAQAVRDTLAPLHRFLLRRETTVESARIPEGIFVSAEPELLRFAIAATVDAVLAPAVQGESLHIDAMVRGAHAVISVQLATRQTPPEPAYLEARLGQVRSWLQLRKGGLSVSSVGNRVVVELTFCRVVTGDAC